MRCTFENGTHSGFPVLFVSGEFDGTVSSEFDAAVNALGDGTARCCIVDLLDVPYSEAAPLRSLLLAHRAYLEAGRVLAVVCCAPFVDKLVELADFDVQMHVFHGLDAAAEYLSASSLC